jgi:hypothetical protein
MLHAGILSGAEHVADTTSKAEPVGSKPTIRSPSCPIWSLPEALDAVRKIEQVYRKIAADRSEAAKLIGYASQSGPANKALADLAAYGLVERAGKGELRVTDRATAILYPDNESERRHNIEAAALDPPLWRELWEKFPGMFSPPEGGVATYLNRAGFSLNNIRPAMKAYLATLAFWEQAGATKSNSSIGVKGADSKVPEDEKPTYGGAKVGDFIQWESNGALQFEKPQRVRGLTDDGEWAFVEGSETGLPMSEVIVQERGTSVGRAPPVLPLESITGATEKGEIEWNRWKPGAETTVRFLVRGPMGVKEIGKLIVLLEAQKAVLED